jgi:hypothetical protein
MDDPGRRGFIRRLLQGSKLWKGIHMCLAEAQTSVLGDGRKMGLLESIGEDCDESGQAAVVHLR